MNAHPHMSGDRLAIVHNGIIENYQELREELKAEGFEFTSQTDTEVVAHLIGKNYKAGGRLYDAVKAAISRLRGAFALAVVHADEPDHLVVCREGSPLVVGVGIGENFIASDQLALLPVTDRFMFLEEGDIADIRKDKIEIHDREGQAVERAINRFEHGADSADKGEYRHYMLKEIYEQPKVIKATMEGRITATRVLEQAPVPMPKTCWRTCATSRSSPVEPLIMPAWWPVTGLKTWPAYPVPWKWPPSFATANT